MGAGTDNIAVLQTFFYIFLALTVVMLIVNTILFFGFNIRLIFNIRTGRAKKKTIQEMQKINSETGRLRKTKNKYIDSTPSSQFSNFHNNDLDIQQSKVFPLETYTGGFDGSGTTGTLDLNSHKAYSVSRSANYMPSMPAAPSTVPANAAYQSSASNGGTADGQKYNIPVMKEPINETTVLSEPMQETTVLSGNMQFDMPFYITEKIIFIHSEEIIS